MAEVGDLFKPGEKAPHSGIYDVTNDPASQDCTSGDLHAGEHLPPCRGCGKGVRFRLAVKALHISEVEDLRAKAA